jgi:hypothetical protein
MENDEKNANWGLLSISNQRVNWELGIWRLCWKGVMELKQNTYAFLGKVLWIF